MRSILFPKPVDFKFNKDTYKFVGVLAGIAMMGFIYTIVLKVYTLPWDKQRLYHVKAHHKKLEGPYLLTFQIVNQKVLIRLRGCAGWSSCLLSQAIKSGFLTLMPLFC